MTPTGEGAPGDRTRQADNAGGNSPTGSSLGRKNLAPQLPGA